MAHYRRSRRSSAVAPLRPMIAFLLIASFGILFAGCSPSASDVPPEEVVFTQEELARARAMATDAAPGQDLLTGSLLAAVESGSGSASPVVDLSLMPLYTAIRSGPTSQQGNLYRVIFDYVNVRREPNVTAAAIGRKERGDFFDVIDFVDAAWAKVRLDDGSEGYVSTQYIAKIVTEEQLATEKQKFDGLYIVDFQFLNVRKEPNTDSERLGELNGQTLIRPLVFENEWAKIMFEGQEAYISKDYLTPFLPNMLVRQERFPLPILTYRLSQPDAIETLIRHASRLKQEGMKLMTMRDFYELLLKQEERDVRLDPKGVVLTVTDVTSDTVVDLLSAVQRNAIPVTVFLQTNQLGLSGITEKTVLSLLSAGIDVQSAGHTGDDLRSLTNAQVDLELRQSRKMLEDITRKPVFAVAYPLGGTNDRVMQLAAQAGYLFGMASGTDQAFTRDMLLRLPAKTIEPSQTGDDLLKMIRGK